MMLMMTMMMPVMLVTQALMRTSDSNHGGDECVYETDEKDSCKAK